MVFLQAAVTPRGDLLTEQNQQLTLGLTEA